MVASTHPVPSPRSYDRRPIAVSPNSCDILHRGDHKLYSPPADFEVERRERGRGRGRRGATEDLVKGSYFHPRAYEASELEPQADELEDSPVSPPVLVADDGDSDLDEDPVTTPPDPKLGNVTSTGTQSAISSLSPCSSPSACSSTLITTPSGQQESKSVEQRPPLLRSHKQTIVRMGFEERWSGMDEGCLGGF